MCRQFDSGPRHSRLLANSRIGSARADLRERVNQVSSDVNCAGRDAVTYAPVARGTAETPIAKGVWR